MAHFVPNRCHTPHSPTARIRVGFCDTRSGKRGQVGVSALLLIGCATNGRFCPHDLSLSILQNYWDSHDAMKNPFLAHWLRDAGRRENWRKSLNPNRWSWFRVFEVGTDVGNKDDPHDA